MPPPPTDQLNIAQILFRKGDYTGALRAFTAILEKWPDKKNPPMSVLDGRVMTLIKLKNYNDALKDTRTMIKAHKSAASGCLGYIRAGQILRKLDKAKKAVEILELGLQSVTEPEAISTLKKELVKTKREIVPDGAKDWIMTTLPREVMMLILDRLALADLVRLMKVCKTWKNVLTTMPHLWTVLDFRSGINCTQVESRRSRAIQVKHKTIETYAKRSHWKVSTLSIDDLAPGTLRMMLHKCKTLRNLHIGNSYNPHDLQTSCLPAILDTKSLTSVTIQGTYFHVRQVFAMIEALPKLVSLSVGLEGSSYNSASSSALISKIPARMTSVKLWTKDDSLGLITRLPPILVGDMLTDARGLTRLEIGLIADDSLDLEHLQNLKQVKLGFQRCPSTVKFPPSVEVLQLVCKCPKWRQHTEQSGDQQEIESLPDLRQLHLDTCGARAHGLISTCGRDLIWLDIGASCEITMASFMERIQKKHFSGLEYLYLTVEATDQDLALLGQHCKALRVVRISDSTRLTGSGIRQLVEGASSLQELRLNRCPNIAADAVRWARDRVSIVSHSAT